MSRRQWLSVIGGLLAAFGLLPRSPKRPVVNKLPEGQPTSPSLSYHTYRGGTNDPPSGGTVTYVYDATSRLLSIHGPIPDRTVTTFSYTLSGPNNQA
jgi:hypothetical protein